MNLLGLLANLAEASASNSDETYQLACACEQIYSDFCLEAPAEFADDLQFYRVAWRSISARVADQAYWPDGANSAALVDHIRSSARQQLRRWKQPDSLEWITESPTAWAVIPEVFSRDLAKLCDYARFVDGYLAGHRPASLLVIGIRTSGSYLAPIWAAAAERCGIPQLAISVRSPRDTTRPDRLADPVSESIPVMLPLRPDHDEVQIFVDRHGSAVAAAVLDDLAFSGTSFLAVRHYLDALKVGPAVFAQNSTLIATTLAPGPRKSFERTPVLVAPRGEDGPGRAGVSPTVFFEGILNESAAPQESVRVLRVERGPSPYMHRYYAARTTVPLDVISHFDPRGRDRHYLVEVETDGRRRSLFAKVLGSGVASAAEFDRLRAYEVIGRTWFGHAAGFMFEPWNDGQARAFGDASPTTAEVDQLAHHAAVLFGTNACGKLATSLYVDDVRRRVMRVATTLGSSVEQTAAQIDWNGLQARAGARIPLVQAPRNQGHWHYLFGDTKVTRVHLELGEWSWRIDPAEDLASTVIELGLDSAQARQLLAGALTGSDRTEAANRLPLGALSYLARALNAYAYWEDQLALIPRRFLRPDKEVAAAAELVRQRQLIAAFTNLIEDPERFWPEDVTT
ncbi:hypothetical protein ACFCV3_05885 [Kribbella sp. NPDC056345]|uniref:hypothetical protein n=1 Tax=Kribbella sp. NPDC056345 TaxID=3345789 RepID=UPI0035DC0049